MSGSRGSIARLSARALGGLCLTALATLPGAAAAASPDAAAAAPVPAPRSIAEAVAQGRFNLSLRARIESVEDAAFTRDALATTLRTRLAWHSAPLRGLTLALEADDVRALDDDAYDAGQGVSPPRPLVADPEGTELNVAALSWRGKGASATLGRQRYSLEGQRIIGGVAWRQNEQTYDGAVLRLERVPRLKLDAAWLWNVNRVYGPRTLGPQAADWHGEIAILNARIDAGRYGAIALIGSSMLFDNAPAVSNRTWGITWTGNVPLRSAWAFGYTIALAAQRDAGKNPTAYDAGYRQLEASLARGAWSFKLGQERLDGDATRANRRFQTPLATLHLFQGWADQFLVTPPQGIDDRYLSVAGNWRGLNLQLHWHDFEAAAVARDYGEEWDLSLSRKLGTRYEALLKLADYRADGFSRDVRKVWVMVSASY